MRWFSTYKMILCAMLALVLHISASAQTFSIDANAILIPPHSLTLADYQLEKSQDLMINLTLNDPVEPFWDVKFRLTISNNGSDILQTKPGFAPAPFRLDQFATMTLTGFELSEYLQFENLVPLNGYSHTGIVPEGLNSICLEVLDYNRPDIVLSRKACGSGYAILNDPPFPQLPICGEEVEFQEAQNLMFSWLPMHIGSPNPVSGIEYEFTLVRVEDGYNEFEAMEAATPLVQETTPNTTIVIQDPILEGGHTYAWQIRVVDNFEGGAVNTFKNDGRSVVCTFIYNEHMEVDLEDLYTEEVESECGASCRADLPTNSEIITDLATDDVVKIGKFFMNVTEISSASGGFYSGKGYIFIPFLLSNMNVTFSDMTVNTDMEVFSGDVVTDIDSNLLTDNFSSTTGVMDIDAEAIASIDDYVEQEGRQFSKIERGSSLGLPIAMDNTIGGVTNNLIITGISFAPDIAYLNAVMSFGSSASGDLIAFGAKGICFQPYGIGGGSAELSLYEDFSLGDFSDIDLTFKAPGDNNDGTYVSFDCNGFQELNVEGEYEFPQDMLVAADGSGEPVVATFNFTTEEWGQFIASLEMDEFEVNGVDGYTFTIEEAYLDFSDVANVEEANFPEDYEDTGDDWKGFYLSTLSMALPEDLSQASGDLSVGVQDVIIDHSGVSANIFAAGLLELETGRLGEWAFSIDTIQVDILSNSLIDGSLLGQIHVPILDEENSLNYSALMTKSDDELGLLFTINTEEDVSVSMWAAEMTLANTSVIAIEKTDTGFKPYAELYGDLTLDVELQKGNAFEVEALAFEGLKVNHPDEDQRLAVDAFSLFGGGAGFGDDEEDVEESEDEEEQESLSGFPVSLSNVGFEEGDGSEAGINFDLNVHLTGDDLGVSGTTNLTLTGEYNAAGAPFNAWKFKGVELGSIEVDAELAAGSIEGSLEVYKGDETYGDGFKGIIGAEFKGVGRLDALAQFGKVDSYRYFFVDAMVLSQSPFVDVLGIGLYGFGGGIYHHMSRDDTDPAMNLEAGTLFAEPEELGASLSGVIYTPDRNTLLGMKAALTMGIAPGTSFSADAYLEASFGVQNRMPTLRSIAFGGKAYFMSPGTILDREDSKVTGQFDANLDISDPSDPIFTGVAQVNFNTDVVTGSGQAAMKISDKESYMWIGTPTNPISIGVAGIGRFSAYADMGDRVPAMPSISSLVPNFNGTTVDQRPAELGGSKVIFGAKFSMAKQSYSYGSFYASAQFGLGFDAYLRQVDASSCGFARGNIGIDNWYLSGQAYAYGSGNIGLKVKTWFYKGNVNLLDLSASVVMQAELPNPTWISGDVAVHYSVLSGAISGDVDYKFEIGNRCSFSENAVSGIDVIADISPETGERNVGPYISPTAVCNLPINEILEFDQIESNGDVTTYQYLPYVSDHALNGGARYLLDIEEDGDLIELKLSDMLEEYTSYSGHITVKWKKRKKGNSRWTKLDQTETKTFSFTTGKKPDFIPSDAVSYTSPIPNRRNVYDVETSLHQWKVYLKTNGWENLFDDEGYSYYLIANNMETGSSIKARSFYNESSTIGTGAVTINYDNRQNFNRWLNAQSGAVIKAQFVGILDIEEEEVTVGSTTKSQGTGVNVETKTLSGNRVSDVATEDKIIYEWYFRKSDYDKPEDKLADFNRARSGYSTLSIGYSPSVRRHYVHGGLENSKERMDYWDLNETTYEFGYYKGTHPAVFRLHRVNYDAEGSHAKSVMDRWNWTGSENAYVGYRSKARRRVYFNDDFWHLGDAWRDWNNAVYSFNKWDTWGNSSPYTQWWCNYCKSELTDEEKLSGKANRGYTKWGSTSFRFRNGGEKALSERFYDMSLLMSYLKNWDKWYATNPSSWHSGGSWDDEVWMMWIENWDRNTNGMYYMGFD